MDSHAEITVRSTPYSCHQTTRLVSYTTLHCCSLIVATCFAGSPCELHLSKSSFGNIGGSLMMADMPVSQVNM